MSDLFNQWHEYKITDEASYQAEVAKALQSDELWEKLQTIIQSEDGGPFTSKEDIASSRRHTFYRYFHDELVATKDKWSYETDENYGAFSETFMELCDRMENIKAKILGQMNTPDASLISSQKAEIPEACPVTQFDPPPPVSSRENSPPSSVLHQLCSVAIHQRQMEIDFKLDLKDPLVKEHYRRTFDKADKTLLADAIVVSENRANALEKTRIQLEKIAALKRELSARRAVIDEQPREILTMMNNSEIQYAAINGYEALNIEIYENRRVTEPLENIWEEIVAFHGLRRECGDILPGEGSPVSRPSLRVSVEEKKSDSVPPETNAPRYEDRTIEIAQRIQCLTPNRVNLGDVRTIIRNKHHGIEEEESSSSVNLDDLRI